MNNQRNAYGEIMSINGEGEDIAHGLVDDTEAVREAGSNGGDRPRNLGPTVVTAYAVDSSGIRDTLQNMSGSVEAERCNLALTGQCQWRHSVQARPHWSCASDHRLG